MNTYFAKVSARITCGFCDEKKLVTCYEELDCPADQVDDWGYYIEAAIEEQKEADGWLGNYCPECRDTHHKEILAIENADGEGDR